MYHLIDASVEKDLSYFIFMVKIKMILISGVLYFWLNFVRFESMFMLNGLSLTEMLMMFMMTITLFFSIVRTSCFQLSIRQASLLTTGCIITENVV